MTSSCVSNLSHVQKICDQSPILPANLLAIPFEGWHKSLLKRIYCLVLFFGLLMHDGWRGQLLFLFFSNYLGTPPWFTIYTRLNKMRPPPCNTRFAQQQPLFLLTNHLQPLATPHIQTVWLTQSRPWLIQTTWMALKQTSAIQPLLMTATYMFSLLRPTSYKD